MVEQDTLITRIQEQQGSDVEVKQLLDYVDKRILSNDAIAAKRVVSQGHRGYYVIDGILYLMRMLQCHPRRDLRYPYS